MCARPIQLGPFELEERIGEGGMGAVYRGRHCTTGMSVALKVISRGADKYARQLFRREVQAHAGLTHPGVVYLFEYGEVDADAAVASGGELVEASPFVAMELAERGTLRDLLPLGDWPTLRHILLQVLDALAAAHARGVIHRDLKPENFLVFADERDAALRIKLADFGIAHAFEEARLRSEESLHSLSGTPLYMPPEQIQGHWRIYGPWTDLYALGCIAWEMICGRPPFQAEHMMQLVLQHLRHDRPVLEPRFAVPPSLEAWVRQAMAIDPRDRFRRAADAAQALPGGETDASKYPPTPASEALETLETRPAHREDATLESTAVWYPTLGATHAGVADLTLSSDAPAIAPTQALSDIGDDVRAGTTRAPGAPESPTDAVVRRSVPSTWKDELPTALPAQLLGTGLGLFGLREVPFVDRDRQRDLVWRALREVAEEATPRVVLVVGDSGAGKSRLVEWITTRAHELGAAMVLRATNASTADAATGGLPGMVRRAFHGWKIERGAFHEHLVDVLPALDDADSLTEADARALTELAFPSEQQSEGVDGPQHRFSGPRQRLVLIARLLRRFSRRRTPIVWLDDAQWDELSVGLMEHCLEQLEAPPPALLVATLRSDVLAEQPDMAERIDALAAHEHCRLVELEELGYEDHRALIDRMLPLEPELTDLVAERTEGNPLFASQLLGDWIERGELTVAAQGFRLREGFQLEVPDDIHQLWSGRLERLFAALGQPRVAAARRAVEIAATLGRDVDADEWRSVCEAVELSDAHLLRDKLIGRGLARRTAEGWSFAHGLLVDTLERQTREAGRFESHHRRCAQLLESLYGEDHRLSAGRRANHWINAGELERSLKPLMQEYKWLVYAGNYRSARTTLQQRERLLDRLSTGPGDRRRLDNDIELAWQDLAHSGLNEAVIERLKRALEQARVQDYPLLVSRASRLLAGGYRRKARYAEARDLAEAALAAARHCNDTVAQRTALANLGWTEYYSGNLDAAAGHFSQARGLAEQAGERYLELLDLQAMAWTAVARGEDTQAGQWFRQLARESQEAGFRNIEAECWNGLGDVARFRGDATGARAHYERSREINIELGAPEGVVMISLNLALVELMAGRFDIAAGNLAEIERRFEALGVVDSMLYVQVAHLVHAAGLADWAKFDRCFQPFERGWPARGRLEKEHPWLFEMAGDYARQEGDHQRARRAWTLARELWEQLGDDSAAERLTERISVVSG